MKFIITENKFYSSFEKYLNSDGLDKILPWGNGIDGCYYPIEWYDYDNDGDYEPAPCLLVYHSTRKDYLNYHSLTPSFDDYTKEDFPLIELDWEIYEKIEVLFGKQTIERFLPQYFEKVIGQKVVRVVSE